MVPATDGWDDLIASLASLIGGDTGIIYIKPSFLSGLGILASYGADFSATLPTYLSYYEKRSPLLAFYTKSTGRSVRALGQFAFSPTYRGVGVLTDWARPQGYGGRTKCPPIVSAAKMGGDSLCGANVSSAKSSESSTPPDTNPRVKVRGGGRCIARNFSLLGIIRGCSQVRSCGSDGAYTFAAHFFEDGYTQSGRACPSRDEVFFILGFL